MSNVDDIYNQITRNTQRRGRSFFPAANAGYRGISGTYRGINMGAQPNPNAINSTTQGETIRTPGGIGPSFYSPNSSQALPPEQNPAYQAAVRVPRSDPRYQLTMINSPNGGSMGVKPSEVQGYLQKGYTLTQPVITPAQQNINQFNQGAAYAKGYGAPAPTVQQFAGGPALVQGGVANPVANISPQQRVQYGVGTGLDYLRTNPALNVAVSALGGFGRNIASWFGGGNSPSIPPATAAQQPVGVPTPTPPQIPPQYDLGSEPRRYSDPNYNYNF